MSKDDDKKENKQKRKVYTTLIPKEEEILRKRFNEKIREIEKKTLKKIIYQIMMLNHITSGWIGKRKKSAPISQQVRQLDK